MNHSAASSVGRRPGGITTGVALFLLALGVRLTYLYESSDNPTFDQPIVDAASYNEMARSIAGGDPVDERFFWQPCFYPAVLSLLYALSGSSILVARLAQLVLGACTCVLTWRLGTRGFDAKTGLLAGLIVAFYGPLLFFESQLLATAWATFWSVVLVLVLLWAARERTAVPCLLFGMCGALSVLTRPTFLPFVIVACLWLLITLRRASGIRRRRIRNPLLAVAGFAAIAAPAAALRYHLTGQFSILPLSGGINVYIGNNPDPRETLTIRPGSQWLELSREAGRHGAVGRHEKQAYYYSRTLEFARSDPLGFLRGLGRKALQFANSREIPRNVDVYMFRRWSWLLRALVWKAGPFGFPFSLLLLAAATGAVLRWRRIPAPLWLFLTLYPLSIILIFVAARYRAPIVPVMSVLAAAGVLAAIDAVRARRWRRLTVAVGCGVGVLMLLTLPGPFCEEQQDLEAEMYRGLGWNYYRAGRLDEALTATRRALELDPHSATAHNNLGMFLRQQQRLEEATAHFQEALRLEPRHPNAHANLAGVFMLQGRLELARRHFAEALRFEPDNAITCTLLAGVLVGQGRLDQALLHYRQALRLRPGLPQAQHGLEDVRDRLTRVEAAAAEYRAALQTHPADVDTRLRLALGLDQLGRTQEAIREYQRVLHAAPDRVRVRTLLAAARERLAAGADAQRVVDALRRTIGDDARIAEGLRADDALSEPVRNAALNLVLRRMLEQAEQP